MILLDTHALLWLDTGDRRARTLKRHLGSLHLSPASLLEVRLLVEIPKLRLNRPVWSFAEDPRWSVDSPPAAAWFDRAHELAWTRDVFDRLLVAHALYRGWKLATADSVILANLDGRHVLEL